MQWAEERVFGNGISENTVASWSGIMRYTNAHNERPFRELVKYCLSGLTLGVSDAVVEHTFSVVNSKTKCRDHMTLRMLDAVVRIRSHLSHKNGCCR